MIFFVLFFSYGYFHQGAGWNHNSRFAQIRPSSRITSPSAVPNPLYDHVLTLTQGETLVMNGLPLQGPVSADPIGVFKTWDHPAKAISSVPRRWHSFNLGEFLWQGSLWSLLPLAMMPGAALVGIWRNIGESDYSFKGFLRSKDATSNTLSKNLELGSRR